MRPYLDVSVRPSIGLSVRWSVMRYTCGPKIGRNGQKTVKNVTKCSQSCKAQSSESQTLPTLPKAFTISHKFDKSDASLSERTFFDETVRTAVQLPV